MTGAIEVRHEPSGVAVVELAGEHDDFTSPKLSRELAQLITAGTKVVVDLSLTDFVDSTTAGVLLGAYRAALAAGVPFVVVLGPGANWPVRRLFSTTRLDEVLPVVTALDDAYPRLRSDRRSGTERRSGRDRRTGRRSGADRRSGVDRRAGAA